MRPATASGEVNSDGDSGAGAAVEREALIALCAWRVGDAAPPTLDALVADARACLSPATDRDAVLKALAEVVRREPHKAAAITAIARAAADRARPGASLKRSGLRALVDRLRATARPPKAR